MTSEAGNRQREKDLGVAGIVLLSSGIFQLVLSLVIDFFALAAVGALLAFAGGVCLSKRHRAPHLFP
jgi:hypothetical protein